ncbi:MAG TPA: hypothetical protein VIO83_03915 [Pseudomonas sp.]
MRVLHGEYHCEPMSSRHAPAAAHAAGGGAGLPAVSAERPHD